MAELRGIVPILGVCLLVSAGLSYAETPSGDAGGQDLSTMSLDEVSRRLDNPLTDLWSLVFQENLALLESDVIEGIEIQNTFFFQPFMPFKVGSQGGYMFSLRPVFPLVTKPVLDVSESDGDGGHKTGFGDIQVLALAGPNRSDGVIWGVGATFKCPTASNDLLGQGKWQAGPAGMVFWMGKPWVIGLLAQHWSSFAGDDGRPSTSRSDIQYVVRRSIPGGWSLGMGPTVSINWKADSGQQVTFPIGLGITKTVRWGGTPWKLRFEPQYSLVKPDAYGVQWNFRIQIAPVISNPFD